MQAATAKQPGLRKNAAVLARDIAAVWTGLRAAVMIDYMPVTRSSMSAILQALTRGDSQGMTFLASPEFPVFDLESQSC